MQISKPAIPIRCPPLARFLSLAALLLLTASAAPVADESFVYQPGEVLAGNTAGSGWAEAWQPWAVSPGASPRVSANNLTYTDVALNSLVTAGAAVDSKNGDLTTIAFRRLASRRTGETWISFLTAPAAAGGFVGMTFYDGGEDNAAHSRFGMEQRDSKATLRLVNSEPETPVFSSPFAATQGQPVFVVIRMVPSGAAAGRDRLDVFFNPILGTTPATPFASLSNVPGSFDRVRIASTDGKSALYDEIRIGDSFADVAPYLPPPVPAEDGLTSEQKIALGLDPAVSYLKLVNAIRANPEFFGLLSRAQILGEEGALVLEAPASGPVPFSICVDESTDLTEWSPFLTLGRSASLPPGKLFLRVAVSPHHAKQAPPL